MASVIPWIQHDGQGHNADDHEHSDENDTQRNDDHNYADIFYPGLGGWHSCFLASVFLASGVGEDEPCL